MFLPLGALGCVASELVVCPVSVTPKKPAITARAPTRISTAELGLCSQGGDLNSISATTARGIWTDRPTVATVGPISRTAPCPEIVRQHIVKQACVQQEAHVRDHGNRKDVNAEAVRLLLLCCRHDAQQDTAMGCCGLRQASESRAWLNEGATVCLPCQCGAGG